MKPPPLCDYCHEPTELVTADVIHPHRPDLAERNVYRCVPCGAWVGCHPGTTRPLGRLANAELRAAKSAAHRAFDPLWKRKIQRSACSKSHARKAGYAWLARELGIDPKQCHIGHFDVAMCERVVVICSPIVERRRA